MTLQLVSQQVQGVEYTLGFDRHVWVGSDGSLLVDDVYISAPARELYERQQLKVVIHGS